MVLTFIFWNIPVSAPEILLSETHLPETLDESVPLGDCTRTPFVQFVKLHIKFWRILKQETHWTLCRELLIFGNHLTDDIWASNQNLVQILYVLILILMTLSGHKFAYVMTAKLSWHTQICGLIWSLFYHKRAKHNLTRFIPWAEIPLWNWSLTFISFRFGTETQLFIWEFEVRGVLFVWCPCLSSLWLLL